MNEKTLELLRFYLTIAQQNGVQKIIFISSMSCYATTKSNYGRAKYLIEQELINNYGGYLIRPGLIYGNQQGGMVSAIAKLAKLPILPLIGGKSKLYFCNYADLLNLIQSIISGKQQLNINQPIIAANSTPYTFKQILKLFGAKVLIPLPWQIVWVLLKAFELIGINLRTGSDNLVSLINQDPTPNFLITKNTLIQFKDFSPRN